MSFKIKSSMLFLLILAYAHQPKKNTSIKPFESTTENKDLPYRIFPHPPKVSLPKYPRLFPWAMRVVSPDSGSSPVLVDLYSSNIASNLGLVGG